MRTLSFGMVEDEAVFMDESSDSYFSLEPIDRDHLVERLTTNHRIALDAHLREALGLTGQAEIVLAHYAPPARSLVLENSPSHTSLFDLARIARIVAYTQFLLRKRPIEIVLGKTVGRKPLGHYQRVSSNEDVMLRAQRFLGVRRLVPIARNCLLDSLSLLHWLGPLRRETALIFAVKLHPFAAHCWVQSGELVLNDLLDNVAAFTPVRVIRCSGVML